MGLPNLGMEPASPTLVGGLFTTEPPGKIVDLISEFLKICKIPFTSKIQRNDCFRDDSTAVFFLIN